jgi:hypothetical protein
MAGAGGIPNMPRDFVRAADPVYNQPVRRAPRILTDPASATHVGEVEPEVGSLIPDSSAWSRQVRAAPLSMNVVTLRGSSLEQYVSRTFYHTAFGYMDVAVKPNLSYWPVVGSCDRILVSKNPFALIHLPFFLDCEAQGISTHPLSAVRYMGAINAVWSSSDTDCLCDAQLVRDNTREFAWSCLFSAEPRVGFAPFILPYYYENWQATVANTPLRNWDFNWRSLVSRVGSFTAFLDVAAALRARALEKEIITFIMSSLHSACMSLISIHGMSDHKWKRCSDELKKMLPAATFLTASELRQEGNLMRGFLIKTTGQVGEFLMCGSRNADPSQFPYVSNTYCRAVMGGLAAIDVITDTMRRVSHPPFWQYMVANFRTEAIAIYRALDLLHQKPFLGFADNVDRSDLLQSNFGVWFAVCTQVQIQILGQKTLSELKKKEPPIPQTQITAIVSALEGAIALPVVFDQSPQDVLDALHGINTLLSQFIDNVTQKIS